MSLKDEVEFVKDSLTGDEKVLESAFRLEKIYNKNKKTIWAALILIVVAFGGNAAVNAYQANKLDTANDALLALQANPADTIAKQTLKTNNPKLYELYTYSKAFDSKDVKTLESLNANGDKILADVAKYNAAMLKSQPTDSKYYQEMVLVEEAFTALKDGKKEIAKHKLALIGENSPVSNIARLLKHYTISLSK